MKPRVRPEIPGITGQDGEPNNQATATLASGQLWPDLQAVQTAAGSIAAWLRARWLRILVHLGSLLPLAWIVWDYSQGAFVVDPIREITTRTGQVSLILLVLTLSCTPLNTLFGFKQALRVRRALGLYTFLYASLHFLTFVGLDYGFALDLLIPAIVDQRYVLVGFAAGLIMIPLAITSTRGWQRRMGKAWKRLHRLVYLAGVLAVVHFLWLDKDIREPLRYGILLALLLLLRLPPVRRTISSARRRLQARMLAAVERAF